MTFKNANMDNYWKKENPKYEELERKIEEKQDRISSGIITNGKTLRYAKRDIKRWQEALLQTAKYLG